MYCSTPTILVGVSERLWRIGRCSFNFLQHFYRLGLTCHPCPNLAWLLIMAFFVALTIMLLVGMWLNQRRVNLAALGIGIDFAQV